MDAVNLWLSTALGVSGAKQLNIKSENVVLVPQKKLEPKVPETTFSHDIKVVKEDSSVLENIEKEDKVVKEIFDEKIISKCKECFKIIESELALLYQKYFNKKQDFKPTLNEVLGDALNYLAHKSTVINKGRLFEKIFLVNGEKVSERYTDKNYLPFAFKLTSWVDKKLKTEHSINVLNGLSGVLFTLLNDENNDEIIINELKNVTKFLSDENLI